MSRSHERLVELITPPGGIGPEVELPVPLEDEVLSVEFPPGEYRAPFPLTPA